MAIVSLSLVALVASVWVTTTARIGLISGSTEPSRTGGAGPPTPPPRIRTPHQRQQHHPKHHHLGFPFLYLTYVLLVLLLLAMLAFLVAAYLARARRKRQFRGSSSPELEEAIDAITVPPLLQRAAENQLLTLREGDPRNAIVACWMALERACHDSGLPRDRAETSTEFTARALGKYAMQADAVTALAVKYREARFSEHRLTESDREQAVDALQRILSDLRMPRGMSAPAEIAT